MTGRRWRWAGAGLVLAAFSAGVLLPQSAFVRLAVADISVAVVPLAAAVACIARSRRSTQARRGWLLLGLSCVAWGFGEVTWSYLELVRGVFPFPSLADAGYLAAYPLAGLALLAFPAAPTHAVSRLRVLLDATVIVAGLLFVSWALVLGPLYHASTGSLLTDVFTLVYPAVDVLLVAIVALVLARATPAQRLPLALIGAGLLSTALADGAFLAGVTTGTYGPSELLDAGWLLGYLLIGLAALEPEREPGPEEGARPVPLWSVLVPYVPFAGTVLVAVVRRLAGYELGVFLFWDAVLLFSALAVRQVLALLENRALVADLHAREADLAHQAFHDPLTGLANRALFRDRVGHALSRQRRSRATIAVLFCDLDDFKTINDSLGHHAGDELLADVGQRLAACARVVDTTARLGGDEFAVLLEDLDDVSQACAAARRILDALATPFSIDGRQVSVRCSIGIAIGQTGAESADDLLRDADVAMYVAKARDTGGYELFDPGMRSVLVERMTLKNDLQRALDAGEFRVHYQPIVDLRDGTVSGVEALVRWQHPERGLLPPAAFLDLAEETGMIVPIGWKVLDAACARLAAWRERFSTSLDLCVNLSARQLQDPDLLARIGAALSAAGLPAGSLVLELTENLLLHDSEALRTRLAALRAAGVRLAIDDFGTGYSSLGYLRQFPFDILKIDKSFADGVGTEPSGSALLAAVTRIGDSLGLTTLAEGVERPDQVAELIALGCRHAQGYHFARPLPASELEVWLSTARFPAPARS